MAACFMPDHLHLLVEGTAGSANLREFVRRAKQLSAYHAIRRCHVEVWGRGYYDRILRHDEDLRRYLRYIRDNPVRAGLVQDAADYPYLWLDTTSWPDL
jgi:putative transposase